MAISQVALSNTFNEFRSTFNDAANTVNTLVPSANAISANSITLGTLTSGRVPVVSTAGLIVDDSNLTYNTSTDVLTLGGATDASSTTTGTLIVTGGVGVAKKLYVGTDLSVAGNATFTGNVIILGSNSEISTTQINVNDPLIQLANNNTSNTVDIGLFGQYNAGSANVHSGVFRDASDGIWKFFKDYNVEPGTTIDPTANGFSYANVNIGALSAANNISIGTGQAYQINGANVLSSTVLGSTVLASSLTSVGTVTSGTWNGTTISVASGGTGVTTSTGSGNTVLSTTPTLTNPTITAYLETAPAIVNSSTTQTIALASGTVLSYTLTGNCTFTMPTATNGTSFIVRLIQDATGSRTATFTGVKWPGGTVPTITTTASTGVDIISFVCIASVWYGNAAQAFA